MSLLENTQKYRKTKKGLVTNLYHKMKERNYVEFNLEWLHKFAYCKKFNRLYNEWAQSNYHKQTKPSIDRINKNKPYTKDNVQWLTWAENRYKQSMERRNRKGSVEQLIAGKVIATYKSQRDAVIKTGLSQGNLSEALNGKREYCGGYKWRWK